MRERWAIRPRDERRLQEMNVDRATTDVRYVIHPNFIPQTLVEAGEGVRYLFAALPDVMDVFNLLHPDKTTWWGDELTSALIAFQGADPTLSRREYQENERHATVNLWQRNEVIVEARNYQWQLHPDWRSHLNRALLTIL